ncbi:MAG: hypothetical protein IT334_09320 [Thermomicrobiales bacterium]|nr:hypothetical protein [Thermomicrobiales bacterium]
MVTSSEPTLNVSGTGAQKEIARNVFQVMSARGRFMADTAPIEVTFSSVAGYLGQTANVEEADALAALKANSKVFSLEERDEQLLVITTRLGIAPNACATAVNTHDFKARLMTPLPKPETPPAPPVERPRVDSGWSALEGFFDDVIEEFDEVEVTAEEEVAPLDELATGLEELTAELPDAPRTITVAVAPATDVSGVDDVELADAIRERLGADVRVASFGDQWMLEDRVTRLSRGELRRLKEYIQEQERPLTDDMLVQDVFNIRPGTEDFDLMRFAVNFRLSKEHREFEFVGTSGQRFWSTNNLPQIGTKRRKPNDIGTDLKYLLSEAAPAPRSVDSIDRVLTYFEYQHGLLPFDAEMRALMPAAMNADQKTAVLTFECPQSYTTYLVELRYPTPNRGGFVLGLDDFFTENLVPGALITIQRTENDGHYKVEYLPSSGESMRLFEVEDRRQRYVFRPTTFACTVDPSFLLSEDRFPRLNGEKPLDDKQRRRPESVISATFERVGQMHEGHGYSASFEDLLAAVNIERPFSADYLRQVLEQDDSGAFAIDPDRDDVYTYVPGTPV